MSPDSSAHVPGRLHGCQNCWLSWPSSRRCAPLLSLKFGLSVRSFFSSRASKWRWYLIVFRLATQTPRAASIIHDHHELLPKPAAWFFNIPHCLNRWRAFYKDLACYTITICIYIVGMAFHTWTKSMPSEKYCQHGREWPYPVFLSRQFVRRCTLLHPQRRAFFSVTALITDGRRDPLRTSGWSGGVMN